ncbi:MAG: 4-alpha-glucanotransferase [Deltaproteobacteria bacterium]|nr:4-alpha-glucanotransferase [Deltaproteobacteria bacterium]
MATTTTPALHGYFNASATTKTTKKPTAFPRSAGVLLHPTSLPSRHGIGDLGAGARAFVDWLAHAGCQRWQILPLVPVGESWSPYASLSALAGNPLMIDLDNLVTRGLLTKDEAEPVTSAGGATTFSPDNVDWKVVPGFKQSRIDIACDRYAATKAGQDALARYRHQQPWIDDDALFIAVKNANASKPWWEWEKGLKQREPAALERARADLRAAIDRRVLEQSLFEEQWQGLRAYARSKGVSFIGDAPIYVADDSADVWAHRELFELDDEGQPTHVAGCPPDAFSETGQWWGSPLYRWDVLKATGHKWWVERIRRQLALTDVVRIDHFRGFAGYWSIPKKAKDARSGVWREGPGQALFDDVQKALGPNLPIIAEDLGVITDDVIALRDRIGLPGMKILQFAFGAGHDNAYLPHHHVENCVIYTGTHDNDTTLGWWKSEADHVRDHVRLYLGRDGSDVVWDFIRLAMLSVGHTAIVPFQDILTLDSGARLNTPGLATGNWSWRVRLDAFHENLSSRLRGLVELGYRLPQGPNK